MYSTVIPVAAENVDLNPIYSTEDGYTQISGDVTTWYDNEHLRLHKHSNNVRVVFLKFEVPEFEGVIRSATLRLTSNAALPTVPENDTLTVHRVIDNDWDSVTNYPTYENGQYIPHIDDTVLSEYVFPSTDFAYAEVVEFDVKDIIKHHGTYSIAIKRSGTSGDIRFFSKEGTTNDSRKPQLHISIDPNAKPEPITISGVFTNNDGYIGNTGPADWINDDELLLNSGTPKVSFLKFKVPSFTGKVIEADLSLMMSTPVSSGALHNISAYRVRDNNWDEIINVPTENDYLSYNPPIDDDVLDVYTVDYSLGAVEGTIINLDVKDFIKKPGTYTIALKTDCDNEDIGFYSKEGAYADEGKPQLKIVYQIAERTEDFELPINLIAIDKDGKQPLDNISMLNDGDKFYGIVKMFNNNSVDDKNLTVVITQYNEDKLVDCVIRRVTLESEWYKNIVQEMKYKQGVTEVKLYVWSELSEMMPITDEDGEVITTPVIEQRAVINEIKNFGNSYGIKGFTPAGANKNVTLIIVNSDSEDTVNLDNILSDDIIHVAQGKSDINGDFEFTITMPDIFEEGIYAVHAHVYAGGEGVLSSLGTKEARYLYVGSGSRDEFRGKVNSIISDVNKRANEKISELHNVFKVDSQYRDVLQAMGFLLTEYDELDNMMQTKLFETVIKEDGFSDEVSLRDRLNEILILSILNAAKQDGLEDILIKYMSIFNLKYNDDITYQALSEGNDLDILKWIHARISETDDFERLEEVNTVFKEAYALYQISNANKISIGNIISVNSAILKLTTGSQEVNFNYYSNLNNDGKVFIDEYLLLNRPEEGYKTIGAFINTFNAAIESWKGREGNKSGNGSRPSGGKSVTISNPITSPVVLPVRPDTETERNNIFDDLEGVAWAAESIYSLASKGIVNGVGNNEFRPNDNITREEFIKLLIEGFGLTESGAITDFKDVQKNTWYYTYIASAQKAGIISGYDDGTFGVGKEITRQDMTVLIYRTAIYSNLEFQHRFTELGFSDSMDIDPYAIDAVKVLHGAGIIKGMDDNRFAPKEISTRAQAAKVIYELLKLM
jgi:hypothetical protein